MKIILFTFLISFSLLQYRCSCTNTNTNTQPLNSYTTTLIFIDITDTTDMQNVLTDEQVINIIDNMGLGKNGNIFNGGEVRFFVINDVSQSISKTITLDVGNSNFFTGTPEITRQEDIKKFIESIKIQASEIKKESKFGKNESEIFRNLKSSLDELIASKSDKKNVIIFSDLLENSKATFSLYSKLSESQIEDLSNEYASKMPNLEEVDIYSVPYINSSNKNLVEQAKKFWEKLFIKSKAKSFKSNINLYMK